MREIMTIPFTDEEVENYLLSDNKQLTVDYKNSEYKGAKFLLYLYNLSVDASVINIEDNVDEIIHDYVTFSKKYSLDICNKLINIDLYNYLITHSSGKYLTINEMNHIISQMTLIDNTIKKMDITDPNMESEKLSKNIISLSEDLLYWNNLKLIFDLQLNKNPHICVDQDKFTIMDHFLNHFTPYIPMIFHLYE